MFTAPCTLPAPRAAPITHAASSRSMAAAMRKQTWLGGMCSTAQTPVGALVPPLPSVSCPLPQLVVCGLAANSCRTQQLGRASSPPHRLHHAAHCCRRWLPCPCRASRRDSGAAAGRACRLSALCAPALHAPRGRCAAQQPGGGCCADAAEAEAGGRGSGRGWRPAAAAAGAAAGACPEKGARQRPARRLRHTAGACGQR